MDTRLNKALTIISKIIEVFMWVGSAISVVIIAVLAIGKLGILKYLTSYTPGDASLEMGGFSMSAIDATGTPVLGAMIIFFITVLISLIFIAMVFRNVNLIMKTTAGKTKFSEGTTPFQEANVRMLREIAIFCFAVPVVQLVMSIIASIVLSGNMVKSSIDSTAIFMGLVILAISQIFAYGVKLQNDVDGLV